MNWSTILFQNITASIVHMIIHAKFGSDTYPQSKVRHHLWKTLHKFTSCFIRILNGWVILLLNCLTCIKKPNGNRGKLSLAAATLLKLDIEFIEIHYRVKKTLSAQNWCHQSFANFAKLMAILLLSINNQKMKLSKYIYLVYLT